MGFASRPIHSRRATGSHQEEIRQIRLRAGMLFQDFNLFPHMTVLGNCIEAPNRVLKVPAANAIAAGGVLPRKSLG